MNRRTQSVICLATLGILVGAGRGIIGCSSSSCKDTGTCGDYSWDAEAGAVDVNGEGVGTDARADRDGAGGSSGGGPDAPDGADSPADVLSCVEGAACAGEAGAGTCHSGSCCSGCWDGRQCQAGGVANQCGKGGTACQACADKDACNTATCNSGACSTRAISGPTCTGGVCVAGNCHCGSKGEPCCSSGTACLDPGTACTGGTCGDCGSLGKACCAGASPCVGSTTCNLVSAKCEECGATGQICCAPPNQACIGGAVCGVSGRCEACGKQGQSCCGGNACTDGTQCNIVPGKCGCPGTGGPKMVAMPQGYCIDSTEVTADQYQTWLNTNPLVAGQPAYCSWNDSYTPFCTSSWNYPVGCVDWCDAYAYCRAVGKRLCGKIGGGANDYGSYADRTQSQWYNACTSGGKNAYPYGSVYGGATCNGKDAGKMAATAAGSMASCQSSEAGYSGVYDLSGNMYEWEDSCNGSSGKEDGCRIRGGSFFFLSDRLRCADLYRYDYQRSATASDVGFRCCAP